MKVLNIKISNLPNFKNDLEIDFLAQQRVAEDDKDNLYNVFDNIYINNAITFVGINASGKTTILNVISFVLSMLNNQPINSIKSKKIIADLLIDDKIVVETIFFDEYIYKLRTVIKKVSQDIDEKYKFIIEDEIIWCKKISSVKSKKSIYEFADNSIVERRNNKEEYLLDDVSIIVAHNKKNNRKILIRDMSKWTNHNMLNILGKYPKELLEFLDPSIEYLTVDIVKKDIDIRLKFKNSTNEIKLNNPMSLENYLSSGTIKGMSIFMNAKFVFDEDGYLIVDEIENHFNKEIVKTLIRFFMNRKINTNGATLILSTHYAELLDEFKRNDSIYIVRNQDGIKADNLSFSLKRNDKKKSEIYESDYLEGTAPEYEIYMKLKKKFVNR